MYYDKKIIWLFGPSGAGKTTLGERLAKDLGYLFLDADRVRQVLHIDPDFTKWGRNLFQNSLRQHVRELQWRDNNIVVASITPFQDMRNQNRLSLTGYIEVYVMCPEEVLIERDPKGLYKKALAGEIDNMFMFEPPYRARGSLPNIEIPTHIWNEQEAYTILKTSIVKILEEDK
jgi:adenylylsulfate kinase